MLTCRVRPTCTDAPQSASRAASRGLAEKVGAAFRAITQQKMLSWPSRLGPCIASLILVSQPLQTALAVNSAARGKKQDATTLSVDAGNHICHMSAFAKIVQPTDIQNMFVKQCCFQSALPCEPQSESDAELITLQLFACTEV